MKQLLSRAALAGLVAVVLPACAGGPKADIVAGSISGREEGAVNAFLGIPYAAPPVGDNRWRPPLPAKGWEGVLQADEYPTSCQQAYYSEGLGPWTHEYFINNEVGEDCLYLTVWTPTRDADAGLPVMVWIHGGGFSSGSGSIPIYNGAALAAKDVVVVGINYRLGVYGFFAHPELSEENEYGASGNYGLLDQVAALRWVKENIAAFGGDPSNVTIAGQSAGAASVHQLIASPLAEGLFERVIAQSGSGMGIEVPSLANAEARGVGLMQAAGASNIADLRALSPAELDAVVSNSAGKSATGALGFRPIQDGYFLPGPEYVGAVTNKTPILTGMTANEMTGMNPRWGAETPESVRAQIEKAYGDMADRFSSLYPAENSEDANNAVDALARERGLASMDGWARERREATDLPVYAYLWEHVEPGPESARYGAFHSSEIPYVFDTLDASPERPFTELDREIARNLGDYWINFVRTGDPNGDGLPEWPTYEAGDRKILVIGDDITSEEILPPETLDAFRSFFDEGGKLSTF